VRIENTAPDTDSAFESENIPNLSIGYRRDGASWRSNASTLPLRGTSSGGGYSTVADLLRFSAVLRSHRLLSARLTNLMLEGKVTMTERVPPGFKYAYGFMDAQMFGRRWVGNSGGGAGTERRVLDVAGRELRPDRFIQLRSSGRDQHRTMGCAASSEMTRTPAPFIVHTAAGFAL
jgi:hypothetical protein